MKPKPHTKGAIEHRSPNQPWTSADDRAVDQVCTALVERIGFQPEVLRAAGEYHVLLRVPADQLTDAKAAALAFSRAVPHAWFILDRLFVRAGRFYRRERGYKLALVPATNVHLPRELRSKLRGIV